MGEFLQGLQQKKYETNLHILYIILLKLCSEIICFKYVDFQKIHDLYYLFVL